MDATITRMRLFVIISDLLSCPAMTIFLFGINILQASVYIKEFKNRLILVKLLHKSLKYPIILVKIPCI